MAKKDDAEVGSTVLRETRGKVDVEWEIRKFVDQPFIKGEYLLSPHFLLGDATWCIKISRKVTVAELSNDWISLFLCRISGSDTYAVSFRFGLNAGSFNISTRNTETNFNKKTADWGWHYFVKSSTISDVLTGGESSDGSLTIVCSARLLDGRSTETSTETSQLESKLIQCQNTEASSSTSRTEGSQAFSKHFLELFLGGNWSDLKIKVGEREFDVHKIVLRARSPVFAAMFDHEMVENSSGVVDIPDMDPNSFRDFLLFVYTGHFSHVTSSNAVCLYKAADKYAVEELKEECIRRMVSDLSMERVLDVIPFAVTYGEDETLKIASEFFVENAEEILITEKWKFFLEQNISIANELLIKMAKSLKAHRKESELRK